MKVSSPGGLEDVEGRQPSVLGKVDRHMREALALKGQAPHTAVVGCADSRVSLETVFDALPGDLFVLRNAGNTCVWARQFSGEFV